MKTYTTGQAARIMSLSRNTVIRACDAGELRCFRCPGVAAHRKIPHVALVDYMRRQGIPAGGVGRVAAVAFDPRADRWIAALRRHLHDYDVVAVSDVFDVGAKSSDGCLVAVVFPPWVVADDTATKAVVSAVARRDAAAGTTTAVVSGYGTRAALADVARLVREAVALAAGNVPEASRA